MTRNTNSTKTDKGRYVHGGTTEVSNGKIEFWESRQFQESDDDKVYVIEEIFDRRPDKLAYVLYEDSRLWWIICQYNNIIDVHDEFVTGKELLIPVKERVIREFLTGTQGGTQSTREF